MSQNDHFLHPAKTWPLDVWVIGCGGNGSQILTGLASLEIALNELGGRSMRVLTFDDDIVTEANLGRQPFFPCDVGRHKAIVLTERINMAYGLQWMATPERLTPDLQASANTNHYHPDLIISCVDTAASRRDINAFLQNNTPRHTYWLDLGNRATDGQIVLGEVHNETDLLQPRLKTVLETFPEIASEKYVEEDRPSCSLAEALEKQSLFINRVMASHALAMLFDLLGRGSISYSGLFVNIKTGLTMPMELPQTPPN